MQYCVVGEKDDDARVGVEPEVDQDAELEGAVEVDPPMSNTVADEEFLIPNAEAARLELAELPTEDD